MSMEALVAIAGGQSALAKGVGCTQGNIWQLMQRGSALPAKYVLKAEAAFGVPRWKSRPDLYPHEDAPGSIPPSSADAAQPSGGTAGEIAPASLNAGAARP